MNTRFPFTPYPSGWFRVGVSRDIKPGQIKPLRYFGRDLVLFRAEDGAARVIEAHCQHLGAHLGHGGRVMGDAVECSFHGWRWNGEGQCEAIPDSQKIPPNAALRCWPVKEVNDLIMVYHDEQGAEPAWEPPEMPEYNNTIWLPFRFAGRYKIRTHVQEVAENGMEKTLGNLLTRLLQRKAIKEGVKTVGQDIPIWENKLYRRQPKLCEGDGPIMIYRRWTRQFHPALTDV
ncbi:MAG: Rieske 2Fe-2S domain-containing protein [Acidobacteria bacterium]|nr:Rieske 2Fe-2S domain-containing protein [Acidobacteriota bacterium]